MKENEDKLGVNTILQNRYEIIELITLGPINRMYKGYDRKDNKYVFIKELLITSYKDTYLREQTIDQFKSEAKILFKLKHKNLPTFRDYFDYEENRYIIMEYVEGLRLNNIVEGHKGFLPDIHVIHWGIELSDVLSYLHNLKPNPVIFRDMRPEAIVLSNESRLKLIDFGIAKIYEINVKTRDVAKIVIPNYSPIEQHSSGTDTRSDIYSLGATMYYLITKEPPMDCIDRSFEDEPIKTCREINPNVSPELDRIIMKAMEMDKKKRYQDIAEMRDELTKLLELFFQKPSNKIEDDLKISFISMVEPSELSSHRTDIITADKEEEKKETKREFPDEPSEKEADEPSYKTKGVKLKEGASEDLTIPDERKEEKEEMEEEAFDESSTKRSDESSYKTKAVSPKERTPTDLPIAADREAEKEETKRKAFDEFSIKRSDEPFYRKKAISHKKAASKDLPIATDRKEEKVEIEKEAFDELSIEEVKVVSSEEEDSSDLPIPAGKEEEVFDELSIEEVKVVSSKEEVSEDLTIHNDKEEEKEETEREAFDDFSIKEAVEPSYKTKAVRPGEVNSKDLPPDKNKVEIMEADHKNREEEIPVLQEGKVIKVRYEVIELLEKSYLSRVYRGMDTKGNQIVLIKEFLFDKLLKFNLPEKIIEKIHSQTRTLLYLDHPNLPDFYDYFIYEGKNYLIMDYIEGPSLKYLMEHSDRLPPWKTVVEWVIQICDVLHYLHRRKPEPYIFRVISSENIILEDTGMLKLIDFGITRLYETFTETAAKSEESRFFSPEEYTGQIDIRSDIYCLGMTMHYLLTGNIPPDAAYRTVCNIPLEIDELYKEVPNGLREIILKATEINKNRRYQNILHMKEALELFMGFNFMI